jgi:hypothetical protein
MEEREPSPDALKGKEDSMNPSVDEMIADRFIQPSATSRQYRTEDQLLYTFDDVIWPEVPNESWRKRFYAERSSSMLSRPLPSMEKLPRLAYSEILEKHRALERNARNMTTLQIEEEQWQICLAEYRRLREMPHNTTVDDSQLKVWAWQFSQI